MILEIKLKNFRFRVRCKCLSNAVPQFTLKKFLMSNLVENIKMNMIYGLVIHGMFIKRHDFRVGHVVIYSLGR